MPAKVGRSATDFVVAGFLDIPANNVAVLQRGDEMEQVPAGQHCITNPNVKLRGLFTCGENQIEMPTKGESSLYTSRTTAHIYVTRHLYTRPSACQSDDLHEVAAFGAFEGMCSLALNIMPIC